MIPVLVCSPVPALRAGLSALISGDPDLQVSGVAATWEELAAVLGSSLPETCVVAATPGGVELPGVRLPQGAAVLLVSDPAGAAEEALRALAEMDLPAWGVITSGTTAEGLQAAIHALAEGLVAVSPEVMRIAMQGIAEPGSPGSGGKPGLEGTGAVDGSPADPLTERETEVLRQLALGLTNKQIAHALRISEHTVKFHVSSIYAKLEASNRTEAVRKGARIGLIPL